MFTLQVHALLTCSSFPDQTAYRLAFGVVSHHSADSTKYAMRILMRHIKNVHLLYAARGWSL